MRNFNDWLSTLKPCISDYAYYIDFPQVYQNVDKIKIELNILNSLIGSKTIEDDFKALVTRYPETLKCIPILLAVREKELYAIDGDGEFLYLFNKTNYPIEQYKIFMRKTGLFDLLENHILSNLIDYVTGVESGLNSHGRKNRGGHLMENLVESYLRKSGLVLGSTYFKEMKTGAIESKWNIDLSNLTNQRKTSKKFDFVIKTPSKIYGIETNFYSDGGSKLNETARSYKTIALEAKNILNFSFVWITDGKGWYSARNNLEETFDVMEHMYNLNDLENGVIRRIFI